MGLCTGEEMGGEDKTQREMANMPSDLSFYFSCAFVYVGNVYPIHLIKITLDDKKKIVRTAIKQQT